MKGDEGDAGPTGVRGSHGPKGARGKVGPPGPRGEEDVRRSIGPIGPECV